MNKKTLIILALVLAMAVIATAVWYASTLHFAVLDPKGLIAKKQSDLIIFTTLLGFVVVIPVFIMTIVIAWRYREGNTKAKYTPNVATNKLAETIWWGIPIILITILSVVTWNSTHDLDPYKAFDNTAKPIKIQVVALDWKWLFIYPEQNIASVNHVQFPVNTPVQFEITSDATMNSFWIPQLGGQIYAMSGMTTKLNLNATEIGDYKGSSANISGEGFAGMKFIARASSKSDYTTWITRIKRDSPQLSSESYATLAKQSTDNPASFYSPVQSGLYDTIVMNYMMPKSHNHDAMSQDATTDQQHHTGAH